MTSHQEPDTAPAIRTVVVGAGVAGLAAAHLLHRQGHHVTLLEASPAIRRRVCGEFLSPHGVTAARLCGFSGHLEEFRPIHGMKLVSPSGRSVKCSFPDSKRGRHGPGLAIDKSKFLERMAADAERRGIDVRFGTPVRSIEPAATGDHRWTVELSGGETIGCDLLVGADGKKSFVAREVGLATRSPEGRIALRAFVRPRRALDGYGEMHVVTRPGDRRGTYIGINPISPVEANLSVVCDASVVRELGGPEATLRAHMDRSPSIAENYDLTELRDLRGVSPIQHIVPRVAADGVALIGDASGFFDPLTGEGISIALESAQLLADELARTTARGEPLDRALGRYARRRKRMNLQKQWLCRGLQAVIRRPWLCERIADFLGASDARAEAFLGAVGSNYRPLEAAWLLVQPR